MYMSKCHHIKKIFLISVSFSPSPSLPLVQMYTLAHIHTIPTANANYSPKAYKVQNVVKVNNDIKCYFGLPWWSSVKNPPCNARDTGLIPGLWDPTCHGATKPVCQPQLLSPGAATTEIPVARAQAPQWEKPPQWDACVPQGRVASTQSNQRKPKCNSKDPL